MDNLPRLNPDSMRYGISPGGPPPVDTVAQQRDPDGVKLSALDMTKFRPSTWQGSNHGVRVADANGAPVSPHHRLQEIGFDPIAILVEQYEEVSALITAMLLARKPSMVTLAQLQNTKMSLTTQLLKYGYVPTATLMAKQAPAGPEDGSSGVTIVFTDSASWAAESANYDLKPAMMVNNDTPPTHTSPTPTPPSVG
jgi:hypothetical protein